MSAAERVRAALATRGKRPVIDAVRRRVALEIALEALEVCEKQWAIVAIERMADVLDGRDG